MCFFDSRLVVGFYLPAAWMVSCCAGVTASRHLLTACHLGGGHLFIRRQTLSARHSNKEQRHHDGQELANFLHRLHEYSLAQLELKVLEKVTKFT